MTSFNPDDLLKVVQRGSPSEREEAFRTIFHRYFDRLLHLARKNLHPRIRQRVDADDIVNSGLKSVFFDFQEGKLTCESEETLWKWLAGSIISKAREAARRHTADKRDVFHEQGQPARSPASSVDPLWDQLAREPTTSEILFVQEIIELLPDEALQQVALGKLHGKTDVELGQELGYSDETIRLKKRRIEQHWRRHFADV